MFVFVSEASDDLYLCRVVWATSAFVPTSRMASSPNRFSLPLDVFLLIVQLCPLPTLCRLGSASALADRAVSSELRWRCAHVLRRFVDDVEGFRRKLVDLDSVVSGSAALAVCAPRGTVLPADLDVYVPACASTEWVQYLTEEERYSVEALDVEGKADDEYHGGIAYVTTLTRPGSRIDIVASLTE